jgi:predicted ATPase
MPNPVFVGRETELSKLTTFLETAASGKTQVVFIVGEAGAGKSSLVTEFVHRAEAADPKLISSIGECNAQTGIADPYLPFRQVLTALTTGNEGDKKPTEKDNDKKLSRWKDFVQVSSKALIMIGPDLIGIFVPGASLLTHLGSAIALNSNLAVKLSERIGKKGEKGSPKADAALDQEKIFEQYAAVLKTLAKDHTLVLILDDLQWADSGSVNLLFHLARQLKDSRVLLVCTYRPDDVALGRDGGRHPLEPILNELKRYYGDIVVDLSQTEAKDGRAFVEALVDSEPNQLDRGFRDELFAHTGGHPLFTVELLRNLQECGTLVKDAQGNWIQGNDLDWKTLPARIEGVIGERVARLPADLHETLRIGSVIGQEFAAQVVGRVQKMDERELINALSRELEKRYLLVVEQGEIKISKQYLSLYHFSHVLLQQYLYGELGTGERRILHGEIADTLESLYADQTDEIALQMARHYEAAGNDEKAIAYLIIAGDGAFRGYAYTEAIAAYTRALEPAGQAAIGAEQLKHVYLQRGRALELNGQFEPAMQNYDAMLADARKRQDRALELASKVAASTLYSTPTPLADAGKGQGLSDETLKLARDLGDRATEARVLWNLQLVNLLQNKASEAIDYGEKSLAIARELNLREQMAYVLSDLGWAYDVACQFEEANERLEAGALIWKELGNMPMLSNNLNLSLFGYFWNGKDKNVLRVAEEAYQISASIKEVWNQASARNFQGQVWFDYGEIDKALEAQEESIRLAALGHQNYEIWYRAMLSRTYGELGASDLGMDLYRAQRVPNKDIPNAPQRTGILVSYALFEIVSNQLETAATTLAACIPDAPPWEAVLLLAKCRLAMAQADFSAGIALADSTIEITRKYKLGQYLPEALFLKGKFHFMQGDAQEAKIALDQARTEAENLGSRRLLWQIIAALAELESDKDLSVALRTESREIVDSIANSITRKDLREAYIRSTELSTAISGA